MEQPNKNIKLVSNKNSRVILPNILTLVGVCIGLTSIKFAYDGKFALSIIAKYPIFLLSMYTFFIVINKY